MKNYTRALSLLLCIVMLLSLLPIQAFSATIVASGYCGGEGDGTNVSWSLDASGILTIRGNGRMADYDWTDIDGIITGNMPPWYDAKDQLQSVAIGEGVTNVGSQAFDESAVQIVSLASTVTEIGKSAFSMTWNLENITLPSSLQIIGDAAFFTAYGLESITIPASVTTIGDSAFAYCGALASITVAADNANYSSVDGVLFNKAKTELLVYPSGKRQTAYTLPSSVKTIHSQAFEQAIRLRTITLPSGLQTIGESAFRWCDSLKEITIPASVMEIGAWAFDDCENINVYFEGNAPSVTAASSIFASFPVDTTLYYRSGTSGWKNSSAYDAANGTWNGYKLILWSNGKKFTLERDNNSFTNSNKTPADGFYDVSYDSFPSALYMKLTKDASLRAKYKIKKELRGQWNGSCYGISSTMALVFEDLVSLNDISRTNAQTYYCLPAPRADTKLLNSIIYYSLSQYLPGSGVKFKHPDNYKVLPALLDILDKDGIAVLSYDCTGNGFTGRYGHAVLAVGNRKNLDGSYTVDIYDMNSASKEDKRNKTIDMTIDRNLKDFSFYDAIGSHIKNSTCYWLQVERVSDLNQIKPYENTIERMQAAVYSSRATDATLYIPFNTYGTITSATGETLIYDCDGFSGTMDILDTDMYVNEDESEWILTVPYSNEFSAECASDTFGLTVAAGDDFLAADAIGIDKAKFSLGAGITLNEGINGDYEFEVYVSTDVQVDENETNLILLSGKASGETNITYNAEKQQVSADSTAPLKNAKGYSLIRTDVTPIPDLDNTENAITVSAQEPEKTTIVDIPAFLAPIGAAVSQMRFVDVFSYDYYYDAVKWAVANNITTGTGRYTFSPDEPCTRAQAVTFLWRAVGCPAPKSSTSPFTDVEKGSYYEKAVAWAVENGITNGTSATTFSPYAACTRAQIVTFLYRAAGSPAATNSSSFADVASDAYYAPAVVWAADAGVAGGTGTHKFSPADVCTRAQIVTFLYRIEQ